MAGVMVLDSGRDRGVEEWPGDGPVDSGGDAGHQPQSGTRQWWRHSGAEVARAAASFFNDGSEGGESISGGGKKERKTTLKK